MIGAMPPRQAIEYMTRDTLLITPSTRDDLLLALMAPCEPDSKAPTCIAGMILTGGTPPKPSIRRMLRKIHVPVILVEDDTFSMASRIAKLIVKIRPSDKTKIRAAEEMVDEFVDVDRLLEVLRADKAGRGS